MTLRQALAYVGYEAEILGGKISIMTEPPPEEIEAEKRRFQAQALKLLVSHEEGQENGPTIRSGDPRDG